MIRTMYTSIDTVKWENIEIENGIDEYCMEQNTTKPQFHDYVFGLIVLLYFHFICYFIFHLGVCVSRFSKFAPFS